MQGDPHAALFHDRLRLSTRGNRLRMEHKLQLLLTGVDPVKYVTIWQRAPTDAAAGSAASSTGSPAGSLGGN